MSRGFIPSPEFFAAHGFTFVAPPQLAPTRQLWMAGPDLAVELWPDDVYFNRAQTISITHRYPDGHWSLGHFEVYQDETALLIKLGEPLKI